jgi:transcriptional regulator
VRRLPPICPSCWTTGAARWARCAAVAGSNPHWRYLAAGRPTQVVFAGAHAYVSPSWYASGPAVPTWNYVAVHASGIGVLVEDSIRVRTFLADLVHGYERANPPSSWSFETLPGDYVDRVQRRIVAFEISIERLEGKAKLSQDRDAVDRARTRNALAASSDPMTQAVAALMSGAPPR